MITQEPVINSLVSYLDEKSRTILTSPASHHHELKFSRSRLAEVRVAFSRTILRGEERLHRLSGLLAHSLLGESFELASVVVGEVPGNNGTQGERFQLVRAIAPEELYSHTDLDLGNRQLARLAFERDDGWVQPQLVASFVQYGPQASNPYGIFKLISRIKAEQELWNKVADEIFDLDRLVTSDKELKHLSHYVKDVFGLKILVSDAEAARELHRHLTTWRWTDEELEKLGITPVSDSRRLEFVEVKDYLVKTKTSGWRALKSVVRWWDQTFEIQIQPLHNYFREQEKLTRESHKAFKARREALREKVSEAIPLYRFYQSLLRWLFLDPSGPPPYYPGVSIRLGP